ncbi:hypothetical protein E1B28_013205 [Marasmius oreades]|uniref:DUF6534 domain-containing protein n=1 Tax=Marasmius oreades TaxID=181124 RepID=A0A9P7RQH8_9AGAR|nr:uncharacterized protein E1B28_013205 [Marasmius oreades]KAG7087223.1 hypothetical protein E1B28_013205 [Marasmius oreades]
MALPFSLYLTTVAEGQGQSLDIPVKQMHQTMGAVLIGVIVASFLYGISFIQAYIYYFITPSRDRWPLKTLVGAVILFDTIHQILVSHTIYTYVIVNYGKPLTLGVAVWSLLAEVLFNGFTGFLVQSFLTRRVWRLSKKNYYLAAPAFFLVFAEFGCIIAFGIKALVSVKTFEDLGTMKWLSVLVNALAAAGDVYITASLSYLLQGSRTGFQRSDAMIRKLINYAVNTGLLTTCTAIASLISILAAPNTFIYIAFFFAIGRLYANSLLCTLNARPLIRQVGEEWNSTNSNMFGNNLGTTPSSRLTHNGVTVHIDTMQKFDADFDRAEKGGSVDEMEMSPIGKSSGDMVHESLEEIHEHRKISHVGHGRNFCNKEDDIDAERTSVVRPPKCLIRTT